MYISRKVNVVPLQPFCVEVTMCVALGLWHKLAIGNNSYFRQVHHSFLIYSVVYHLRLERMNIEFVIFGEKTVEYLLALNLY